MNTVRYEALNTYSTIASNGLSIPFASSNNFDALKTVSEK
jgi:hypothetical protein